MDDEGATLLKNTYEQSFVEKLRSLLKFGANSRRYKDIFDIDDDEASRKTIQKNGGIYESTVSVPNEGINLERYWIKLS